MTKIRCPNNCEDGRMPVDPLGYEQCKICNGHGEIEEEQMNKYPRGKLNEDDQGAAYIAVGIEKDAVVIKFGKPMTWLGMARKEALALADAITKHAEMLKEVN